MKLKSLIFSLTPPLMLVLVMLSFGAPSNSSSNTSSLWGTNGELHSPTSRLPDFSFAGYHSGLKSIPNNIPIVTNAADFGAVGDGITDDTNALRNAINGTFNGALFIPPGRYKISSRIFIRKSNIVIRGAGEGQTIIFMPKSLSTLEGRVNLPYDGAFFQIGRVPSFGSLVGKLSVNAQRGDLSATLDRVPNVAIGQSVELFSNNSNSLGLHLLDGQTVGSSTPREYSYYTDTVLKVAAINGNTITFDRPLRLDARPEWDSEIYTYKPFMTEFGIEDLTFEMGGTPKRNHNNEEGFNAIDMTGGLNCWIRRVTFIDADNCLLLKDTRFSEFSDLTFKAVQRSGGDTGHHAMWVKDYSQSNLFTRFDIQTNFVHELSVEAVSHGNVFSDGFAPRLRLDHHANLPYENLFTNLRTSNIGNLYTSGSSSSRRPHTAARSTVWNVTTTGGNPPAVPNWPLFNVIGVTGYTPKTTGSGTWIEPIANIFPQNLHLAQQQKLNDGSRPTPVIICSSINGATPLNIQFNGTNSTVNEGTITSYNWDFGDGSTSTGPSPSHTFRAGTYTVSLTIVGSNGLTSSRSVIVTSYSTTPTIPQYTQWQNIQNWGLNPTNLQGANNDPDNDGINNNLERILGTSPISPDGSTVTISENVTTNTITIAYPKSSSIFAAHLQRSADLITWTDVTTATEQYNATTGMYFFERPVDNTVSPFKGYRVRFDD